MIGPDMKKYGLFNLGGIDRVKNLFPCYEITPCFVVKLFLQGNHLHGIYKFQRNLTLLVSEILILSYLYSHILHTTHYAMVNLNISYTNDIQSFISGADIYRDPKKLLLFPQ